MQANNKLILYLIVLFTILITIMGGILFALVRKYYNKLKIKQIESLSNLILGQDKERERIARDLHDEMGPDLSSIIFIIDKIVGRTELDQENQEKAKKKLKESITKLRQISHDIMPISFYNNKFIPTIEDIIEQNQNNGILIIFNSNCTNIDLSENIKSNFYKIFKELIYNTKKHSNADTIEISINYDTFNKELECKYFDNGISVSNQENSNYGVGIKNIKTRVELINGQLELKFKIGFYLGIKVKLN